MREQKSLKFKNDCMGTAWAIIAFTYFEKVFMSPKSKKTQIVHRFYAKTRLGELQIPVENIVGSSIPVELSKFTMLPNLLSYMPRRSLKSPLS